MKTLYKLLATTALALVLFVPAKNAQAGGFPAGVTFKQIVGKVLEPHAGDKAWTTLDAIDFGFVSRYVKICLWPQSAPTYLRMNTTIARTVASAVANTNLFLYPGDSSTIFIDGTISGSFDYGAMSMRAAASDDAGVLATGSAAAFQEGPKCITEPWATPGIIAHVASGLATLDVWGYR